jgi:alkylated DNA repair dioxygenase AlkB
LLLLGAATAMTSTSIQTPRRSGSPAALTPRPRLTRPGASIGEFWQISRYDSGQIIAWHNDQTTGYTAVLGLALQHHKAVVVCSDVARVDNLRNQILA